MKKTIFISLITSIIVGILLSIFLIRKYYQPEAETIIKTDTIYQDKIDTFKIGIPDIREKVVVKKILVQDTVKSVIDTSDLIALIPIETKEVGFKNDSIEGKAVIKGYKPQLLNIDVKTKTQVPTITIEKEKTVTKKNKVSIGPMMGVGYGLINQKVDVFVGVGLTYNF